MVGGEARTLCSSDLSTASNEMNIGSSSVRPKTVTVFRAVFCHAARTHPADHLLIASVVPVVEAAGAARVHSRRKFSAQEWFPRRSRVRSPSCHSIMHQFMTLVDRVPEQGDRFDDRRDWNRQRVDRSHDSSVFVASRPPVVDINCALFTNI